MFKKIVGVRWTTNRILSLKYNNTTICGTIKCAFNQNSSKHNLTSPRRNFHLTVKNADKLFRDTENDFAFGFLQEMEPLKATDGEFQRVTNRKEFDELLNQNWRKSTASQIVKAFKSVQEFSCSNQIRLSDVCYDKLVDGLMDNCEHLADEELFELLKCLGNMPSCDSISAHNFHDVWSCLDDICCWKMGTWNFRKQSLFIDAWYNLNLGRLTDYVFEVLDRVPRKLKTLPKNDLIRFYFYINIVRRKPIQFECEHALAEIVDKLNVNELGIIAMGHFKSRTKIKLTPTLQTMINAIIKNAKTIHEITLASILKVIRFSQRPELVPQIEEMLEKLYDEIPRLSVMCCLQISLIGTGVQYYHPKTLQLCCQKIIDHIDQTDKIRIKDIERILLATTMFDFDPHTSPDFYHSCYVELHKPERQHEFVTYKRCLTSALHYLSLRGIYSHELSTTVLDDEYINENFGKRAKLLPLELLSLDASLQIECADYDGNRLGPVRKYKAVKWLTEFIPDYNQYRKLNAYDTFFLDVVDHVKLIVNDDNYYLDHVLPHFHRGDIILCRHTENGFIKPFGFENYILGDVKWPFLSDDVTWFAIVLLVPNTALRNTTLPLGSQVMKARQLKNIGYNPCFIAWSEFSNLSSEDKVKHILKKLNIKG